MKIESFRISGPSHLQLCFIWEITFTTNNADEQPLFIPLIQTLLRSFSIWPHSFSSHVSLHFALPSLSFHDLCSPPAL